MLSDYFRNPLNVDQNTNPEMPDPKSSNELGSGIALVTVFAPRNPLFPVVFEKISSAKKTTGLPPLDNFWKSCGVRAVVLAISNEIDPA